MSSPVPVRPWPALGFGWILALIVAIVAALGLLHAIDVNATIVQVEILLLALAVLL